MGFSARPACPCTRYLSLLPVFHDDDDNGDGDDEDDDGDDNGDDDDVADVCGDDDVCAWPFLSIQLVCVLIACLHYQYSVVMMMMIMVIKMVAIMVVTIMMMMMMMMMMMVLMRGLFCQYSSSLYSLSFVAASIPR